MYVLLISEHDGDGSPETHAVCVLIKHRILFGFLTLEDGTDRFSQNVGKELPLHTM
jgi:hypothetical protein